MFAISEICFYIESVKDSELSREVLCDQIHMLYRGVPVAVSGTLIISVLTSFFFWRYVEFNRVSIWLSAVLTVSIFRIITYIFFLYLRNETNRQKYPPHLWEFLFLIGTALSAVLWGISGIIFYFPHDNFQIGILAFILGGLAAVSATTLSYRKLPFLIFISFTTFPLALMLFLEGTETKLFLLTFLFILVVFSIRGGMRLYSTNEDNIRLKIIYRDEKETLKKAQQHHKLHVEQTPLGVIEWDTNLRVTEWNPAAQNIFGYSQSEAVDLEVTNLIHESDSARLNRILETFSTNDEGNKVSAYCRRKDGSIIFCNWYNTPLINEDGIKIGLASLIMDITLENKILDQLVLAKNDLEKAAKVKSEFLSHMSHELRTPMNSIMGFSTLLKLSSGSSLTEDQKLFIEEIHKSSSDLLGGIENMLNLHDIEKGMLLLKLQSINLEGIIAESIKLIREEADKKEVKVINEVSNNITIPVLGDRIRLKQVIINVLHNAVKYNFSGGHLKIKIGHHDDKFIHLLIEDTGIGLSENEMEEVFQSFARFGKDNVDGTGIGLTIARHLMTMMNGDIQVASNKGNGTVVTLIMKKMTD